MAAHRVLLVIGTRPEVIKMAPVAAALAEYAPEVETRVALTGQHTTLVKQVLGSFALEPHYDLEIMKEGQTLYDVVQGALEGLRRVVDDFRPDVLLVQGDTATVFTASLVGFFEKVLVGHVEAGLRSGDKSSPFPEEVLRRLTDVIADFHFAPTFGARELLLEEKTAPERVHVTGNTVVDALLAVSEAGRPVEDATLRGVIDDPARRLVLMTAHRRESFGAPLREIFQAVRTFADEHEDVAVVYPVHPNPNVSGPAHEILSGHPRVHLTEPLDYFDLVAALRAADLVLTDSGGIQEEAPTFGTPVLVLREVTERPEGVDVGAVELVGSNGAFILDRARRLLAAGEKERVANPYGDGQAGARIADIIVSELTGRPRTTSDWSGA